MNAKSRPYQFSLRSLLVAITIASFVFSWWAFQWQRISRQDALLKPLRKYDMQVARNVFGQIVEIEVAKLNRSTSDQDLQTLRHMVHLRRLDLRGHGFSDAGIATVGKLVRLEHLTLRRDSPWGRKLSDAGLAHLQDLASLTSLTYTPARISDVGLQYVGRLSNLHEVALSCPEATDQGLESLAKLERVQRLSLYHSDKMTGTGLNALPKPEILQWLCLSRVSDEGMHTISRFSNLDYLWIGGPDLTAQGLSWLRSLNKLEMLTIKEAALDTLALEQAVSGLPILKKLHLIKCPLEEADREPLRRLEQSGVTVTETEY